MVVALRLAERSLGQVLGNDDPFFGGQKRVIISCLGDSITYGEGDDDGYLSYPSQLELLLGKEGFQVKNYGRSGATIVESAFEYRKKYASSYEAALASGADVFIVQFGTNDAHESLWNETVFEEALEGLALELRSLENSPAVLLMIPPPYVYLWKNLGDPALHAVNLAVPGAIADVADHLDLYVVDNWSFFGGYPATSKLEWFDVPNDGLHPNGLGYENMALNVYDILATDLWPSYFGYALTSLPSYGPSPSPTSIPTVPDPTSTPTSAPSYVPTTPNTSAPSYLLASDDGPPTTPGSPPPPSDGGPSAMPSVYQPSYTFSPSPAPTPLPTPLPSPAPTSIILTRR